MLNCERVFELIDYLIKDQKYMKPLFSDLTSLLKDFRKEDAVDVLRRVVTDFYNYFVAERRDIDYYWPVFKYLARLFNDELDIYRILGIVNNHGQEMHNFIMGIVDATVQNSFENTLEDSYEGLLQRD